MIAEEMARRRCKWVHFKGGYSVYNGRLWHCKSGVIAYVKVVCNLIRVEILWDAKHVDVFREITKDVVFIGDTLLHYGVNRLMVRGYAYHAPISVEALCSTS